MNRSPFRFLSTRQLLGPLAVLLLISFAFHAYTLLTIFQARSYARAQIDALRVEVAALQDDVLHFDLPLNQRVPVRATVPINQHLTIPISTTVAIDNTFEVPLETPFGRTTIPVPIKADVPINTTVPIAIATSVDISTTVALDLTVPIDIPVAGTAVEQYLLRLKQTLDALATQL